MNIYLTIGLNALIPIKIASVLAAIILCYLVLNNLAKKGIFVTYVRENTVAYIKKGEAINRILWAKKGKYFDKKLRKFISGDSEKLYTSPFIGPFDLLLWNVFGMRIVGLPPIYSLDNWHFIWSTYKKDHPKADKFGIVRYDEYISWDFLETLYVFEFTDVKIKGNFEITVRVGITIEMEDPYYAHTTIQPKGEWLNKFKIAAQTRVLQFFAEKSYDEIRKEKFAGKETDFYKFFLGQDPKTDINIELYEMTRIKATDLDWGGFQSEENEKIESALKEKQTEILMLDASIAAEDKNIILQEKKTAAHLKGQNARDKADAAIMKDSPNLTQLKIWEQISKSKIKYIGSDLKLLVQDNDEEKEKKETTKTEQKK